MMHPGPVSNFSLVDLEPEYQMQCENLLRLGDPNNFKECYKTFTNWLHMSLKPELQDTVHFLLVPPSVWLKIVNIYGCGGPEICFFIVNSTEGKYPDLTPIMIRMMFTESHGI